MSSDDLKNDMLTRIARANTEISVATKELDVVISSLPVAERAHKTQISKALDDAIRNLRTARAKVLELETLLRDPDTED